MPETQEKTSERPSFFRRLFSDETVLPLNDKGIVSDNEYSEQRGKLFSRSKLQFWWRSVSKVFTMVAAVLLPAAVTLLIMGITKGFGAGELTTLGIVGGVSAAALAVGIGTDYFENVVNQRQSFDREDFGYRRHGTAIARAINEEIVEKKSVSPLSEPRQPALVTWEEKTRSKPEPASFSLHP